jgi:hypothetical protein
MRAIDLQADYETICGWWRGHGQEPIPREHLPATGRIVDGVAACFLYRTDAPVGLIEHLVAAPGSDKDDRREAVRALIAELVAEAKRLGADVVYALTPVPGVADRAGVFSPTHVEERVFTMLRRSVHGFPAN